MQETEAFSQRGLDAEVASDLGATFESGRFVFAYKSHGKPTFRKIRRPGKEFHIEPSGAPLHFWNIDSVRKLGSKPKHPLVITEGEFDTCAIKQSCNGVYVLSVPNGANGQQSAGAIYPNKDTGFKYLWDENGRLIHEIDQFDKIILATDGDEKGILLRQELSIRIGPGRCWYVLYPEGYKDPNDILLKWGERGVARLIDIARPIRPGHLLKPSELPNTGPITTYSTGWAGLDPLMMVTRPELMVVTGVPGHGKTLWARLLSCHLALAHGWRTAFLNPEDPHERLVRDIRRFADGKLAELQEKGWKSASDWIDHHFRISNPPIDERITMPFVFNEMETSAFQHDCQVFVTDPWSAISHNRGNRTDTEYTEDILEDIKAKGRRLNLLNNIIAHPRKIDEGVKPDLNTINGSSHWRNKVDHGVSVYRSTPDDDFVQVCLRKCKDHETMGVPGTAWMTYKRETGDYTVDDINKTDK
jgi:twinkle protein